MTDGKHAAFKKQFAPGRCRAKCNMYCTSSPSSKYDYDSTYVKKNEDK